MKIFRSCGVKRPVFSVPTKNVRTYVKIGNLKDTEIKKGTEISDYN